MHILHTVLKHSQWYWQGEFIQQSRSGFFNWLSFYFIIHALNVWFKRCYCKEKFEVRNLGVKKVDVPWLVWQSVYLWYGEGFVNLRRKLMFLSHLRNSPLNVYGLQALCSLTKSPSTRTGFESEVRLFIHSSCLFLKRGKDSFNSVKA